MRRSFVLSLILAGILSAPAFAGETKRHEPGTSVEMPFLIAPLTADGKLIAYAYIQAKLIAASPAAAVGIRDKMPFLQDAFVRDVNAAPIGKAGDPSAVDQAAFADRLLADARRILGAANVESYVVTQLQVATTRPNQT